MPSHHIREMHQTLNQASSKLIEKLGPQSMPPTWLAPQVLCDIPSSYDLSISAFLFFLSNSLIMRSMNYDLR